MRKLFSKKPLNLNSLYHAMIGIIACILMVLIIQWDKGLFKTEFREGDIALRAIYAPYDFNIKTDINIENTNAARKKAMDSVLPVYVLDSEVQSSVLKKIHAFKDSIATLKNDEKITDDDKQTKIREAASSYNLSESLATNIYSLKEFDRFFYNVEELIENLMSEGIISALDKTSLLENKTSTIILINKLTGNESTKKVIECQTFEDLRTKLQTLAISLTKNSQERTYLIELVNAVLNINIIFDKEKTESRKRTASEKIVPIYNTVQVKKNETIINKGDRIGKEHIVKLKALEESESPVIKLEGIFAITILVGLLTIIMALYIAYYQPGLIAGNKELLLLSIISIMMLLIAKLVVMSPLPSNLIPAAVASMLIAILLNHNLAIIITCLLSILIGIIAGNRLDITGLSLVGGVVGTFAMRGVRRRSQVIAAGLCIGFANMSYLIVMGIIRALDLQTSITESFFGFANGIASAVIVTGILPIFENLFKVTTDISLLELADLNHPLLKEMVIKAPGTYHHSLVVGNLAEAACEAIGANSLLARVGSYFHDIGKIEKASYFSENQPQESSAHDKLSPTMSSLIITSHVKNGVELAQRNKLNEKIIDIIQQHHGTGLVFYFFKRALEKGAKEEIEEQPFRYPGPKPQTKEAACVLLADSVEAASRALDEPSPSRIKGLVRKIINNKFIDGQLDECDLTLKNLEKIAECFTHILTGIFHTRVEYPEGHEHPVK